MKLAIYAYSAIALLCTSTVGADCTDELPVYESFTYPSYGNDDDDLSNGYGACNTDFFKQDFPLTYTDVPVSAAVGSTCSWSSANTTSSVTKSCTKLLDLTDCEIEAYDSTGQHSDIVGTGSSVSDAICCSAHRFTKSEYITTDVDYVEVTINIEDEYGDDAATFMELCEEFWACSSYTQQYAALKCDGGRGCTDYEARSLCFDSAYNPSDDDELQIRETFIVEQCYGAGLGAYDLSESATGQGRPIDSDNDEYPGLVQVVEMTCDNASDQSDRYNFEPADPDTCDDIITCMMSSANSIIDTLEGIVALALSDFDDLLYDFCSGDSDALAEMKEQVCGTGASSAVPYVVPNGNAPNECRPLPTCPDRIADQFISFEPDYPSGDNYELAVASISGSAIPIIENGLDNRTTADQVALFLILKTAADEAVIITEAIKDALPDDFPYMWKVAPYGVAKTLQLVFGSVLEQADLHDGLVDAAEVEAMYENTRQLLDGSAAIYDEVVCRCVEEPLRGHGCDSIDNDCDQSVDECDEDQYAPDIDIGQSLCQCASTSTDGSERWFTSSSDALECVDSTVTAVDDCDQAVREYNTTIELFDTCYDSTVVIDAVDECGNQAVSRTVPVYIDEEDPAVTCSFDDGSGPTTAIEVDETGSGVQYDVNLDYTATDNCGGPLDVTVQVYANEVENFHSQQMALLYQAEFLNKKAGLYIASTTCTTSANGQCIKDPILEDNRLYTVVVSAVDSAGRSSSTECTIMVVDSSNSNGNSGKRGRGLQSSEDSTQRFFLTSYTSVFEEA